MDYSKQMEHNWVYPDVVETAGYDTDDSVYAPENTTSNNDFLTLD